MAMDFELRDVREADLDLLLQLNARCEPNVGRIDLERLRWFCDVASYFKVADGADGLLAFLIALAPSAPYQSPNFLWFKERYDDFLYIDRVAVVEAARRGGVGRAIYADVDRFALAQHGRLTCEVNTRPRNEVSLVFHQRLGFETVGSQETEGGTKTVAMLMKPLNASDRR